MLNPNASRAAPSFLGQEFNTFLFAPVGTDCAGGQLSVVSALARLDLDAWAEAASLARLPREAAVNSLAGMLRRFPEIPHLAQDSGTVAARLIALLPGRAIPPRIAAATPARWTVASVAGLGILVAVWVLFGLQFANRAPDHLTAPASVRPAAAAAAAAQPPAPPATMKRVRSTA